VQLAKALRALALLVLALLSKKARRARASLVFDSSASASSHMTDDI
jgi:hypothetical protein